MDIERWVDFAKLNNLTEDEFSNDILTIAQAILPKQLKDNGSLSMTLTTEQLGEKFELVFTNRTLLDAFKDIKPLNTENKE